MTSRSRGSGNGRAGSPAWRTLRTLLTMVLLAVVGCAQRDSADDGRRVERETPWQETIAQAKAFTYRIGFVPTANFTHASADLPGFPYCGRASKLVLPYSYEDPAIEWLDVATPEQCRDVPPPMESYHGMSEAVGEVASPVTPSMIASGVPRMIYLVVHEDCHDQFTLPYGIEEPLCELISYRAMTEMATQPGPWSAAERRAIRDYALHNAGRIPLNLDPIPHCHLDHCYDQLLEGVSNSKRMVPPGCATAVGAKYGVEKPFDLVFHGGSGSLLSEIREALDYGVVKMNIDTDTQYAFTRPIVDHMFKNYDGVLKIDGEVGNKKQYDPRTYGKLAEAGMAARVTKGCEDLRSVGTRIK